MSKSLEELGGRLLKEAPSPVSSIINAFLEKSYQLTLIGGGVRQFLLGQGLPRDLDFEIRHPGQFTQKEWFDQLRKDVRNLARKDGWEISELKFGVFRLFQKSSEHAFELEIATPRKEVFETDKKHLGHSDFEVEVGPHIPYEEAFKRRDFTINAMGCELSVVSESGKKRLCSREIDPFGGRKDLDKKILRPCSEQFFFDPVRFLRMIRFQQKLNFQLAETLKSRLGEFDLSLLTPHYFLGEGLKWKFFQYCYEFYELVDQHKIAIPAGLCDLRFLRLEGLRSFVPQNKLEIQGALILAPGMRILDHEREAFTSYAQVKKGDVKKLIELKQALITLKKVDGNYLRENVLNVEFDQVKELELFDKMHIFHRSLLWMKERELQPKNFIAHDLLAAYSRFQSLFTDELKGEKKFFNFLSVNELKGEEKSRFRIFCHLHEVIR